MRKRSVLRAEEALAETLAGAPFQGAPSFRQETNTRAWMTVQSPTVNGSELGAQEWRDALFLKYGLDPPYPPKDYNGCNANFSICHALYCKRGGLFMARHNKLHYGVVDLVGKYFEPNHVCDDLLIFAGCAVKIPNSGSSPRIEILTSVYHNYPLKGLNLRYIYCGQLFLMNKLKYINTSSRNWCSYW